MGVSLAKTRRLQARASSAPSAWCTETDPAAAHPALLGAIVGLVTAGARQNPCWREHRPSGARAAGCEARDGPRGMRPSVAARRAMGGARSWPTTSRGPGRPWRSPCPRSPKRSMWPPRSTCRADADDSGSRASPIRLAHSPGWGRVAGWMARWLAGWLTGWLTGWLGPWPVQSMANRPTTPTADRPPRSSAMSRALRDLRPPKLFGVTPLLVALPPICLGRHSPSRLRPPSGPAAWCDSEWPCARGNG